MHPPFRQANRSTFGEALIVISVITGFFVAFLRGQISLEDIWTLAGLLLLIVCFYMSLLFCRMLFFWMTGGDTQMYGYGHPQWGEEWQKHQHHKKK